MSRLVELKITVVVYIFLILQTKHKCFCFTFITQLAYVTKTSFHLKRPPNYITIAVNDALVIFTKTTVFALATLFQLNHLENLSLNYFCQHTIKTTFRIYSINYFNIFHSLFCQLSHVLFKPKDQLVFYKSGLVPKQLANY